jgi:hypothetical protein
MKKLYYLFFFCSVLLHSQERYFLNSDTRLYTSTSTSATFLGYFKYGAEVRLLSESKNGWYKVQADNFSEGYVEQKFVTTRLNAKDVKIKDPENPIIEGSDGYYGSGHLFVLAAGLKARTLPDKNAKIKEILFTGDPVAVDYLPINQDDWVNINGNFDPEYARYTLRKFIGERPNFDALIKEFDNLDVNAAKDRKTLSERIVELAWNSDYSKLEPAYQRYYEVVKQVNDPKLLADTELNMAIAKGFSKHKTSEEIIDFSKKISFFLGEDLGDVSSSIPMSGFTFWQMLKFFGDPVRKARISDECGLYISDLFYYYPNLEVSVDPNKNKFEIIKVYMGPYYRLILNTKDHLDNSASEKAFIDKYGAYIEASIKSPHKYSIMMEDSQLRIVFKDGKLFSVEIFYYC